MADAGDADRQCGVPSQRYVGHAERVAGSRQSGALWADAHIAASDDKTPREKVEESGRGELKRRQDHRREGERQPHNKWGLNCLACKEPHLHTSEARRGARLAAVCSCGCVRLWTGAG